MACCSAPRTREPTRYYYSYDDPLGLTGAFNETCSATEPRLKGRLRAEQFGAIAVSDSDTSRVGVRLVAGSRRTSDRAATLPSTFEKADDLDRLVQVRPVSGGWSADGFQQRQQSIDQRTRFALTLFAAV